MKYVLDACALIAFFRDEPGSGNMEGILAEPGAELHIHAVNLLEIHYKMASYGGELSAQEFLDDMTILNIQVHETLGGDMRERASCFKTRYPFLSLADSVCVALADLIGAAVVTSDRPFANIEPKPVIRFIRGNIKQNFTHSGKGTL